MSLHDLAALTIVLAFLAGLVLFSKRARRIEARLSARAEELGTASFRRGTPLSWETGPVRLWLLDGALVAEAYQSSLRWTLYAPEGCRAELPGVGRQQITTVAARTDGTLELTTEGPFPHRLVLSGLTGGQQARLLAAIDRTATEAERAPS